MFWRSFSYKLVLGVNYFHRSSGCGGKFDPTQAVQAAAELLIDTKSRDPIVGTSVEALAIPTYLATQVDIIRSDRVAGVVVRNLGLAENPGVKDQWLKATEGRGDIETWLANGLSEKSSSNTGAPEQRDYDQLQSIGCCHRRGQG